MTTFSDLSWDLVEEVLSRVPITSLGAVRSTCKGWRSLFKNQSFTKKHYAKAVKQFLIMNRTRGWGPTPTSISLHNIKDLPSIKEIGKIISLVQIYGVYQCDGLFLCVLRDKKSSLVVWNPYLLQTRLIQASDVLNEACSYAIGYDNNNNHKVLRVFYSYIKIVKLEIYNFRSNSWSWVHDITTNVFTNYGGVSLKGNTYFVSIKKNLQENFVICFDFTTERYGPCLNLPFYSDFKDDVVVPSCVRGEQLGLLHVKGLYSYDLEIWITTRIEPDAVSWSKFFKVKPTNFFHKLQVCGFFVDNEKKLAVICGRHLNAYDRETAYMVGESGNYEETSLKGDVFSYVPSLVHIQH